MSGRYLAFALLAQAKANLCHHGVRPANCNVCKSTHTHAALAAEEES